MSPIYNIAGLVIGPLLKRYSPRTVCAAGSLLTGFGLILSSFTTELWQVCISYGLLVGTNCNLKLCFRIKIYKFFVFRCWTGAD